MTTKNHDNIEINIYRMEEEIIMTIRIFGGGTFSNKHESKQLRRILPDIIEGLKFGDKKSWIFIESQFGKSRPDLLVVKEDCILIIDMKNKRGKIKADFDEKGNKWEIEYSSGKKEIYEKGKMILVENGDETPSVIRSPSEQVIDYRKKIKDILRENVDHVLNYKGDKKNPDDKDLLRMIGTVIIFPSESRIQLENYDENPIRYFLSVISEEDNLARIIIDEGSDYKFPKNICDVIRENGHAPGEPEKEIKEMSEEDVELWLDIDVKQKASVTRSEDEITSLKNKLKRDLKSESSSKIKDAIKIIEYSGWISNFKPIIFELKGSERYEVRDIAFEKIIEMETDPEEISNFILEFLEDEDPRLRIKAIGVVMDYSITNAAPILTGWLEEFTFSPISDRSSAPICMKRGDKTISYDELKLTIDTLGILEEKAAVEPLINVISEYEKQDLDEYYKRRIILSTIETLGDIGSEKATDFLQKYLDEGYYHESALLALANIGDEKSSKIIVNRFKALVNEIKDSDHIEDRRSLSLYLRAIEKIGGDYAISDIHSLFELAYGRYRDIVTHTLKIMRSTESKESFDIIFELFKKNPKHEHYIPKTLDFLDKEKFEDEVIECFIDRVNNNEMNMARKMLDYKFLHTSTKLSKRENADKIFEIIKNIEMEKPSKQFVLLEKISFIIIDYIESQPEYYETNKEEIYALLDSGYTSRIVIGIHIILGAEKERGLLKLKKYLEHEKDIVIRAVFSSIFWEEIKSKEILPILFNNIHKLKGLDNYDGNMTIAFLGHLMFLRDIDIGKNYCRKNNINIPDFFEDVIIEHDCFENLEYIAFFWGEESISLLKNIYERIRVNWKEEHPNSANRKSRYIMKSCKIIDSEKTIPILEKIIEDTDQKEFYGRDLNSDCRELIAELDN